MNGTPKERVDADSASLPTSLGVVLAAPRGFCAGVRRAVEIVERALERAADPSGDGAPPPVHVRHEIVHNRHVVTRLAGLGAVFVEELDAVPAGGVVVFSAHGVPKSVPEEAARLGLRTHDATCPLVTKVHREAARHHAEGRHILLVGHPGHPEMIGTAGQVPPGAVSLVPDVETARAIQPPAAGGLAYLTQTTLSVDEAAAIVAELNARFPGIVGPRAGDICYATTNRQNAVKAIAASVDALIVLGSPASSNARRLVDVALAAGCARVRMVECADEIDWDWVGRSAGGEAPRLGVTAGASTPETLVDEVLAAARRRFRVSVEEIRVTAEDVTFKLPPE